MLNVEAKNSTKEQGEVQKDKIRDAENRNVIIIIAVVVVVFLLALVPIIVNVVSDSGDDTPINIPDTGEVLSGVYSVNVDNAGSSKYTFDGNKVTNVYNGTTIEYTYVIAVENGVNVIKLTTVSEDGSSQTTTHEFEKGKFGDTPIIMINDVIYYLEQ